MLIGFQRWAHKRILDFEERTSENPSTWPCLTRISIYAMVYSNTGIQTESSSPLTPDPPGQLNVLGHDGHPLGMDGLT